MSAPDVVTMDVERARATPTTMTDAVALRAGVPLPIANPAAVHRAMPDGAVLFLPATEVYFGLNTTGAFVWAHLAPTCDTVGALCEAVARRYPDADPADIAADVGELLAALADAGLVVPG